MFIGTIIFDIMGSKYVLYFLIGCVITTKFHVDGCSGSAKKKDNDMMICAFLVFKVGCEVQSLSHS